MGNDEWLRLPDEKERCPVTGLSRTSLSEFLAETDPDTGEKLIVSIVKRKPGATRGIRLIKKQSLLSYLDRLAASQTGLCWSDHIKNPERLTIDEVTADLEYFRCFMGFDNEVSDEAWELGDLSTRRARVTALLGAGALKREPERRLD